MPGIAREQAEALIQEQVIREIVQDTPTTSVFLSNARRLPNMSSNKTRMPVLDMLPLAYWVNGDNGQKKTTMQQWDNVYINAEELAVIVPIPEAVVSDSSYDIFGEVMPRIREAFGLRVDEAAIFHKGAPASWPLGLVIAARNSGNNVSPGTDLYDALMSPGGVWDKIESMGSNVTGVVARPGFQSKLRELRDEAKRPIFIQDMSRTNAFSLLGTGIAFPDNGAFDPTVAQLIAGDWSKAVYSIRQDVTAKIFTEGVIQDEAGNIVYNLMQQDMIALRIVFRLGWALPKAANRLDPDRLYVPFAYLEPATPVTLYSATFTVTDNAGTPAAVADAIITIKGARKKTNASGVAVFNLTPGTYTATVKKNGYTAQTTSVTITSANVTAAVTLPLDA